MMKFANVRALKNNTSAILRDASQEAVIITSQGKPRAILTGITEEEFEDYLLEHSPVFLEALEAAREEYHRRGGTTVATYRRKRKTRRA